MWRTVSQIPVQRTSGFLFRRISLWVIKAAKPDELTYVEYISLVSSAKVLQSSLKVPWIRVHMWCQPLGSIADGPVASCTLRTVERMGSPMMLSNKTEWNTWLEVSRGGEEGGSSFCVGGCLDLRVSRTAIPLILSLRLRSTEKQWLDTKHVADWTLPLHHMLCKRLSLPERDRVFIVLVLLIHSRQKEKGKLADRN